MYPAVARDNPTGSPGRKQPARPGARGRVPSAHLRRFRWYVRPALQARRNLCALALAGVAAWAGCGGGERQDEDEPEGEFAVEVVRASFPEDQKLAKSSNLVLTVRNAGDRTIPNIAVTVDGFNVRKTDPDLADPERPQFVINGVPRQIGGFPEAKEASPLGCDSAYVNTWACGPLAAGKEKSFRWSVTAVEAGDFEIDWKVAAGLDGKAKAVSPGGGDAPAGSFSGNVSDEAPEVRVADDGKTVVEGTR
jgi:hypothetical protein